MVGKTAAVVAASSLAWSGDQRRVGVIFPWRGSETRVRRYPDGGGLTASGRARREQVRLHAAALFEHGITPVQVAGDLWVSTKSAYQWRRRWHAGGTAALASTGPGGPVPAAG
ncbi:helix-turn-helix domain-containing protein [Nonomuraea sp. NPDC003709]|uniref:helix-turn-helix domain-containing protein n=1 Tax=Nonomuraea sp. NPDC003709 TaxID=3154450 RepID=UPI0033AC8DA9